MIYLDSSAVVKLVHRESGTAELVAWLSGQPETALVSSALVEVEVPRALRRHAPAALAGVPSVLARLFKLEIDSAVRAMAASYEDGGLRSLDAIHLATADLLRVESSGDLTAFAAYDRRLLASAASLGMPVVSPGGPTPEDA